MKLFAIPLLSTLLLPGTALAQELLANPGFESGDLSGWTTTNGTAVVVSETAGMPGCQALDPPTARTGSFFLSTSDVDGGDGSEVRIEQIVSLAGGGELSISGFFSGAIGCGGSSDDTAQLQVTLLEGGPQGNPLATHSTDPLDPVPGSWNAVELDGITIPAGADTARFELIARLDPGFASIDIGVDDLSLELAPSGLQLDLTGDCPGTVTVTATGATPDASVGLLFSPSEGTTVFAGGPCPGLEVGLENARLFTVLMSDPNGEVSLVRNAPSSACGSFIQAVDASTCEPSKVVDVTP